jgi:hypothetical protein
MDTCSIEVGLLKKKPCGQNAVTKCANCEQPLCAKHATAMMSGGKKTMLCGECAKAWKDMGEVPATPAAAPKPAAAAPAPKAAHAPAPKPAAVAAKAAPAAPAPAAAAKPAAGKPGLALDQTGTLDFKPAAGAAPKPAPAAPKPAAAAPKAEHSGLDKKPQLSLEDSQPLEFTPSKKPGEKK